jgi:hypothetical protein
MITGILRIEKRDNGFFFSNPGILRLPIEAIEFSPRDVDFSSRDVEISSRDVDSSPAFQIIGGPFAPKAGDKCGDETSCHT